MRMFAVALMGLGLYGAEARWIRLRSAHFEMFTTASERDARETLRYFEQVRSFFSQGMGSIPTVRIVGFNSRKEYEPYRINNFATAFYHGTDSTDEIVLSSTGGDVFPVAVHEYVHLVTKHMGMKLPPWLGEGMAELYSTLKPMGDRVLVGTLIEGRHQALLRERWVPLEVIVKADRNSPYYNERDQAGSLYNEGWALTHMLVLTNEYRPGFAKFLEMVNAGTPTEEALNKVYGKTIGQVDKELQAYLRGTHFQGAYFALKIEKAPDEITSEPAPAFDVKLVLAELLNRPGKEKETREAFERLAAEEPKRPEPVAALGYLAWRAKENEEAQKDFSKAFELGDRDPRMLWDYARMLRGRDQTEAIRVLSELVAKEPARNDVRMELAAHQLTAKQPREALETLKAVREEASRLYIIRAHAQLDLQQFSEAKESAERLAKVARSSEDRREAESILRALEAPVGRPRLARRVGETVSEKKSVAGAFVYFDCSGGSKKVVLESAEGQRVFLIDDPDLVLGSMALTCGVQKRDRVRVDFILGNQAGVDGLVRGLQVEP